MGADHAGLTERFAAIGLPELEAIAALPVRIDVKYVIAHERLASLTERLRATHSVLEIDGRRAFAYRTTYFDTPELTAFREHLQRRRRRYKARSREYVDSGLCTFEVKLKGPRGRTIKHRMPYEPVRRNEVSEPALAFLHDCVERSYGRPPAGVLRPALEVAYTRVTFAALGRNERLTCDFDVTFSAPDGTRGQLARDMVIVESKSLGGRAIAERELRALGARPEPGCSKYCLGVGFTRPDLSASRMLPLLRRHVQPA